MDEHLAHNQTDKDSIAFSASIQYYDGRAVMYGIANPKMLVRLQLVIPSYQDEAA